MPEIRGIRNQPIPIEQVKSWVGPGWGGIIEHLVADLFALGWDGSLYQVKEKYGGLRFYIGNGTQAMYDRIRVAERASFATCEQCGTHDEVTVEADNGWILTLCPTCRAPKKAVE